MFFDPPFLNRLGSALAALLLAAAPVMAPPAETPSAESGPSPPQGQNPLREISPGIFQIGLVQLDKNKRTVSFPGSVNMRHGVVEYLLVSATGKLHESVLKTDAEPTHVHLALLLLTDKAKPASNGAVSDPTLAGQNVFIRVRLQTESGEKEVPGEDLVFNTMTRSPMSPGEWIFNGSRVVNGIFIAQRDGSIVSTIRDPDAMINNPRPGRTNEEIWHAHDKITPPVNTPVEILVQLGNRDEGDKEDKDGGKPSDAR